MILPNAVNPAFLGWLDTQEQSVKNDVEACWAAHQEDKRLLSGHRNIDYARLRFLMDYCRDTYGYKG